MIRKRLAGFFRKLLKKLEEPTSSSLPLQNEFNSLSDVFCQEEEPVELIQEKPSQDVVLLKKKTSLKTSKQKKVEDATALPASIFDARDISEMMEIPFLSLSKNRKNPIYYEGQDGRIKVKVTPHTGHFLASIYDWDVVLFVASKMQEILNTGSDIPPRTMVFPRHEILKALHKHDGKKEEKDLKGSLSRLKLTGIETTIRNEDYKYEGGFGFLDSWGYTKRKDVREITVTLSQWLYDGICAKGTLLKVNANYFDLSSGLKRFLYRTARKHVGTQSKAWEFSVEKLYEKSGSEREFRKFKSDLKNVVMENDVPEYHLEWIQRHRKSFVSFKNAKKLVEEALSS